ncbi:MAG: EamA family transporter [Gammaproteobacteria bacterium]|nr:EamA family transporter [Gammaproteobacteria bacterium]
MRNNLTSYLLLFLLAAIWSTSFLLIKIGVQTVGPMTLTAIRLTIASAILCLFLAFKRETIPLHKEAWLLYFVVGLFGNTLPFLLISTGEVYVDSVMAAILMGCMPICTFVLAHFFIREEPMTLRRSLGVFLGFIGLLVLVGASALTGLSNGALGELLVLAGAISYAITTIFVRLQPSFKGYQMAAGVSVVAALTAVPLAFIFEDPLLISPSKESIAAIVALAVFATAIASLIYFEVIRVLGATTFAQINYIIPVLGSIWGILFLGELLEIRVLFALGLVLCGIYLIQSKTGD